MIRNVPYRVQTNIMIEIADWEVINLQAIVTYYPERKKLEKDVLYYAAYLHRPRHLLRIKFFQKMYFVFLLLPGVHWEGPALKMADRQIVNLPFSIPLHISLSSLQYR